jgi:hypothetical protein
MKNERLYSQFSTYFKRHMGFRGKRILKLLRAAGETESTKEKVYIRLA